MRLTEKVTHLEPSTSTNSAGETTTSYTEGAQFWASADVGAPTETRAGSEPEESSSVTLTVRSEATDRIGLARDSRLRWDGDDLRVQGIIDHRRTGFDELTCERVR